MISLLIYTPVVTPRIKYTFNFIFREILGCEFEFANSVERFRESQEAKISYGNEPISDELFFCTTSLLQEHKLRPFEPESVIFGDQRVPFPVPKGSLPFDLFAASFYLISRYEEYIHRLNSSSTFNASSSIQNKLKILESPVIDEWALLLKNIIAKRYPHFKFTKREFKFLPTINSHWTEKGKSDTLLSKTFSWFKTIAQFDLGKAAEDLLVQLAPSQSIDPYEYFEKSHRQVKPLLFLSLPKAGILENSTQASPQDAENSALSGFWNLKEKSILGLLCRESEHGFKDAAESDLQLLKLVSERQIDSCRLQNLDLQFPRTYLHWLKIGIRHDYSMGYYDVPGFRAGTCTPFFWYDLQLEKQSALKVYPVAIMDHHFIRSSNLIKEIAMEEIKLLVNRIRLVDGLLCTAWQTSSFADRKWGATWKEIYDNLLVAAQS